jgi:hypothetical protein
LCLARGALKPVTDPFTLITTYFYYYFFVNLILDAQGFIQQLAALGFQKEALNDFSVAPLETKPIELISLGAVWAKRVRLPIVTFFR